MPRFPSESRGIGGALQGKWEPATLVADPHFVVSHTVLGWFGKLPDQDSNLEQTGYTCPHVSARSGLSHHPRRIGGRVWGARGWLIGSAPHHLVSAPSRLLGCRSSSLAQDCRHPKCCGFPEFTPFFRRPLLIGAATNLQPVALPLSYRGSTPAAKSLVFYHPFIEYRRPARKATPFLLRHLTLLARLQLRHCECHAGSRTSKPHEEPCVSPHY